MIQLSCLYKVAIAESVLTGFHRYVSWRVVFLSCCGSVADWHFLHLRNSWFPLLIGWSARTLHTILRFLWENLRTYKINALIVSSHTPGCSSVAIMPPKFANVRKVMLKHKRAAKCPFLQEFIIKCVALAKEASFVSSEEMFKKYCRVVSLLTEEDSARGQTQYLMKKGSF